MQVNLVLPCVADVIRPTMERDRSREQDTKFADSEAVNEQASESSVRGLAAAFLPMLMRLARNCDDHMS
jgi:hypothetical protein